MTSVRCGDVSIGADAPLTIIAGPCAAESEALCLQVAQAMQQACRTAGVSYIFKASFDKANRSSAKTDRGPGMDTGLAILATVRERCNVPVITDIHLPEQAVTVAKVVDALQIPAFLCRQTDLIVAAAATGKPLLIKKGQFVAPQDMGNVVSKARAAGAGGVILCERGSSFGYHNLVVDMRALPIMRATGCPVAFDATHATQLPGAGGDHTGGNREFAAPLARAAVAVGVDVLFLETHPDPANAISDAAVQQPLAAAAKLIADTARIAVLQRELA